MAPIKQPHIHALVGLLLTFGACGKEEGGLGMIVKATSPDKGTVDIRVVGLDGPGIEVTIQLRSSQSRAERPSEWKIPTESDEDRGLLVQKATSDEKGEASLVFKGVEAGTWTPAAWAVKGERKGFRDDAKGVKVEPTGAELQAAAEAKARSIRPVFVATADKEAHVYPDSSRLLECKLSGGPVRRATRIELKIRLSEKGEGAVKLKLKGAKTATLGQREITFSEAGQATLPISLASLLSEVTLDELGKKLSKAATDNYWFFDSESKLTFNMRKGGTQTATLKCDLKPFFKWQYSCPERGAKSLSFKFSPIWPKERQAPRFQLPAAPGATKGPSSILCGLAFGKKCEVINGDQPLSNLRYIGCHSYGKERKLSPCKYRQTHNVDKSTRKKVEGSEFGYQVDVPRRATDAVVAVYDLRSGELLEEKTLKAPTPRCPSSKSGRSDISSYVSDEEKVKSFKRIVSKRK